jgi:hypothetical protein
MCPGEPTIEQGHIDAALTNFAIQQLFYSDNYIANIIAPPVPVPNRSDEFFIIDPREGLSDEHEEELMYGQPSTELNFVVGKGQYACKLHGKKHLAPDGIIYNADTAVRELLKGDSYLLNNMRIKRERALWRLVTEDANYDPTHWIAISVPWDADDSVPKKDIDAACRVIELNSGVQPNVLVVPPRSYDLLTENPDVKDLIKGKLGDYYLRTGTIGDVVFNLKLVRAGAIFDRAAPLESSNIQFIWEDDSSDAGADWALLCFVDPAPGLWSPGAFAQFIWNMNNVAPGMMGRLRVYRDEDREGEWHDFRTDFQMMMTNKNAAAMLIGIGGGS